MRRFITALSIITITLATAAFTQSPSDAAFDIKCAQYNSCTFTSTSGHDGIWIFADITENYPVTGISVTHAMSTHDPVTFETPFTTKVTHIVGDAVEVGFVKCVSDWNPHRNSMCRKANR
jgi:hypothetical protein